MMYRILQLWLIMALTAFATPAAAQWHRAESDNFVIYAEEDAEKVEHYATLLERYHAGIGKLTGKVLPKPSPSNRLTIFVTGNSDRTRKLLGGGNRLINGFFLPRAGNSVAFVSELNVRNGLPDQSFVALLHEYAHYYTALTSRFSMPAWLEEGHAEYLAATRFGKEGGVAMGGPTVARWQDIYLADKDFGRKLSARELLDSRTGTRQDAVSQTQFYARAWMLYFYLLKTAEREGQLDAYIAEIRRGADSLAAAEAAFGDLTVLDRAAEQFFRNDLKSVQWTIFEADELPTSPVQVTKLGEIAGEMLPTLMVLRRGASAEEAGDLAKEVARLVDGSNDPFALAVMAEAYNLADNSAAALEMSDKALSIDPNHIAALLQKGRALFRIAGTTDGSAEEKDAAYAEAMAAFTALNALENDHPAPLVHYYLSFIERGLEPPEQARLALERAAQLAPFDKALWLTVGIELAREGKIALAIQSVLPVATDPHGGDLSQSARLLIARLQDAEEGRPFKP